MNGYSLTYGIAYVRVKLQICDTQEIGTTSYEQVMIEPGAKKMKMVLRSFRILCVYLVALPVFAGNHPGKGYTMKNEPSGEYYEWKKTKKPERSWLLPYHQTVVMKLFLCSKKQPDTGVDKVFLTFEEALDVITRLDNITFGVPKIVYLVGWQGNGHDSKYPSLDIANKQLKRPQDKTAVDSLRWLMREGAKHNTAVSLHINIFDAYETSPLWKSYDELDILAKDKQGKTIRPPDQTNPPHYRGDRPGYISYTREWELGFLQKRIDSLLKMLPELTKTRTIHIDAFHACRPHDTGRFGDPISPWLGYTMEQEVTTMRRIFRYWRNQGLDVTSEGSNHLRPDAFVGLQPMSWWDHPEGMPPELYCGSPMHIEEEVKVDSENLPGLLDQFCLMVVPWYYRNNTTTVKGNQKMLEPDVGPKRQPRLGLFEPVMAEYGNHVFMPALWREKTIVAYSRTGYKNKTWQLPPDWKNIRKVTVSRITQDGLEPMGESSVTDGKLTVRVKSREALVLSPKE